MLTVTEKLRQKYGKCSVAGCEEPGLEEHHILYDHHPDGPVTGRLCEEHHIWITLRQSHAARKQHHALSARQRWYFWYELIEGRMKRPRQTHLDREWRARGRAG